MTSIRVRRIPLAKLIGQPVIMHDDRTARFDECAKHRPQICERAQQAGLAELDQAGIGVGMVVLELGAVVVDPFTLEEHSGARVMELPVVQHHKAGIPERVRPHVIVIRRISDLIDDQVVRRAAVPPDKFMRCEHRGNA